MKIRKAGTFLVILIVIAVLYLFGSSIERVRPGEVDVVLEIGLSGTEVRLRPRPLVNPGPKPKWFFKQPVVPFLKTGYVKETFSIDEQMEFSASFAYYTLYELTGESADKEMVNACRLEGRIEAVTDWQQFVTRLDPERYDSGENLYGVKFRSRDQILAEQIKYLIRSAEPEALYPGAVTVEELMLTPGQKIDFWFHELVSRRNLAVALKDRYGFDDREQYVDFLMHESPWYWFLGVRQFESLLNQAEELARYLQSPYSEDLSIEGYAGRYINDEDYLQLVNMVKRADSLDRRILNSKQKVKELCSQMEMMDERIATQTDRYARMMHQGYLKFLAEQGMQLADIESEELNDHFLEYVNNEIYFKLVKSVRKHKLELTIDSLAEYKTNVISDIVLDAEQAQNVKTATEYIKNKYANYLESDEWEYFSTTFSDKLNEYFSRNPGMPIPGNEVIQMVYYRLLDYYLERLHSKYSEHEPGTSELFIELYAELIDNPLILGSGREKMAEMIADYLMADEASVLIKAGSIVSADWALSVELELMQQLDEDKENVLLPYFNYKADEFASEENEELWLAAIDDVINGEDLSRHHEYFTHFITAGETLEYVAGLYGIEGTELLRQNRAGIAFDDPENQKLFNFMNTYRCAEEVYLKVKALPLKAGELVSVNAYPAYTADWWDERGIEQKRREMIIRNFAYPWIDQHLPAYFREFTENSPYIEYIENYFGVRLSDMQMIIEPRSIFSNPKLRQVDPDFIGVYSR